MEADRPGIGLDRKLMDTLSRDDFAAHLNTTFQIYFMPEEATEAKLIAVSELTKRARQESFSIVFQGPPERIYYQRMMKLEHPELGTGELFLVPIGQNEEGVEYEALFNRVIDR